MMIKTQTKNRIKQTKTLSINHPTHINRIKQSNNIMIGRLRIFSIKIKFFCCFVSFCSGWFIVFPDTNHHFTTTINIIIILASFFCFLAVRRYQLPINLFSVANLLLLFGSQSCCPMLLLI